MKLNLTMRYAKGIIFLHILTITLSAPNHVQSAQQRSNVQNVSRYNASDADTRTKQINLFDKSKISNNTGIHNVKPQRRQSHEAWSLPTSGDEPNSPDDHVANGNTRRSRKYHRKSRLGDQPLKNRNNQVHDHASHPEKRGPGLQPVVECGEDSMTLLVRGGRVSVMVDGANASGLALSQLPPQCGYSVKTNWRDLRFEVAYNACHVQQEEGRHVLPLIWRGIPVEMSCPVSETQTQPATRPSPSLTHVVQFLKSSVCCDSHGLTFTLPGQGPAAVLKVKVREEWRPLLPLPWQCGYSLNRQQGGEMLVSASYNACGVLIKDGQHTLVLRVGEEPVTLVCPADLSEADQMSTSSSETWASEAHPLFTRTSRAPPQPPTSGSPPTAASFSVRVSAGIRPRPHIHPYYRQHQIPLSDSNWAPYLSNDQRPTVDQAGSEPGLKPPTASPPAPSRASYLKVHTTQMSTSVLNSFTPVPRSAPLLTPDTEHHPSYHFYHHPKIPVPFPDPAEEPGTGKPTVPGKRAVRVDLPALISSPPISRAVDISHPSVPPASLGVGRFVPPPSPHLNQPPRAALHRPSHPLGKRVEESASADSSYNFHPGDRLTWLPWRPPGRLAGATPYLPPSSDPPQILTRTPPLPSPFQPLVPLYQPPPPRNYLNSPISQSASRNNLQKDPTPAAPAPAPSPDPLPPPYPYIYHPYYYHGGNPYRTPQPGEIPPTPSTTPGSTSFQTPVPTVTMAPRHHSVSPRSHYKSKMASRDSPLPPRSIPLLDEPLAAESPFPPAVPPDHPLYPYYYYYYHHHHHHHQPRPTPAQDQGRTPPPVPKRSKPPLDLDQPVAPPSDPHLTGRLYSQPSPPMSQQQQPAGLHPTFVSHEKVAETADVSSEPVAQTPCGLHSICSGPVESYTVKGCTAGRHFVFAVPATLESTVTPPLSPEASNESCIPQRVMRADSTFSDLYTVPLHGCGIQTYEAGKTVVHQSEVKGVQAPPTEEAPIRLMVERTGSPGVQGKVTIRRMSPAPPPSVQTAGAIDVQLRIATDEQYDSFLPEPHLPLAQLLGRPLYLELVLLKAPETGSVLLVHYCLAYTQSPHTGWMLVYDGCPRDRALPAPPPSHTQRLTVTAFQALSTQRPLPLQTGSATRHPENPEVYFLCSTEVCSSKDGGCSVGCITGRTKAGSLS